MEVVERLFLDGIRGQRRNCAVDQCEQLSVAVQPRATPAEPTWRQQAAALADIAANLATDFFGKLRLADKNASGVSQEGEGRTWLRRIREPTIHEEAFFVQYRLARRVRMERAG
jgi:hypothetical protein